MKMYKSKLDKDLYYYFTSKKEKLWCYRYFYYDVLGKRKEKAKRGFKTEKEAYRALLEVKSNLLNGNDKQVEHANLTISEWLDIWYDTHKNDWKVTSQEQRKMAIKYQMKPLLGKYKLAELDKITYKRVFINKLLKKYKPSTVQLFHRLFKVAINAAVDDEILPRNRFNKITIEQDEPKRNFLTAVELNKLLAATKQYENETNYTFLLTLAYSGMRKGEALGIQWNNIDFKAKTITIERTRDVNGIRTPKTKNSYRTILMDDMSMKQLQQYKSWCKQVKLSYGKKIKDNDLVFISFVTGEPISDTTPLRGLGRVIEKVNENVEEKDKITKISLHGLRHTHATLLISQRIPVKVIAERLGNTPQMIFDIYGHTFKELESEAVTAFNDSLQHSAVTSAGDK